MLITIKTPSNLYRIWNIGSLIALRILIQIIVGFILSINYFQNTNLFSSSFHIYFNLNYGWLLRLIHRNLTSLIFILIFTHIIRNIIFKTLINTKMWISGILIILTVISTSFLGYSLIWNQISYWAIIVITNFISSIPYLGIIIVKWIWGDFNINNILINRFFSLHFIIPNVTIIIIILHLIILHYNKSSNPLGLNSNLDLINLNPIYISKDFIFISSLLIIFINLNLINPWIFNNSDNFNQINYFKTPNHIEPEWYFIFFYSILRSIENKFSGLLIIMIITIIITLLPYFLRSKFQTLIHNPSKIILTLLWINSIIIISYLGSKTIEFPFTQINNIFILIFILYYPAIIIKK